MLRLSVGVLACFVSLGLSACGSHQGPASPVAAATHVAKPTDPKDTKAWNTYLAEAPVQQLRGTINTPYKFLVPAGDDAVERDRRQMIQAALMSMASNNSFPGTVITVGGPDPAKTASVLVAAFGKAKPHSLKSLTLVYIGDDANRAGVEKVVTASGAEMRFTQM